MSGRAFKVRGREIISEEIISRQTEPDLFGSKSQHLCDTAPKKQSNLLHVSLFKRTLQSVCLFYITKIQWHEHHLLYALSVLQSSNRVSSDAASSVAESTDTCVTSICAEFVSANSHTKDIYQA